MRTKRCELTRGEKEAQLGGAARCTGRDQRSLHQGRHQEQPLLPRHYSILCEEQEASLTRLEHIGARAADTKAKLATQQGPLEGSERHTRMPPRVAPEAEGLPVTTQQAEAQQGDQAEASPAAAAAKARRLAAGLRTVGRTLAGAAAGLNRALNREHHHHHHHEEAVQATASAADHEAELRQAFALYDRNGDGTIDMTELRAVLHAMGQHPGRRELRALMDRMDTDGSGAIDYEEFAAVMRDDHAEAQEAEPEMKQMQDLFRVIDRDGSGKLSPAELQAAIKAMGVVMSKAEVEFLVTQIDTDGDGEVDCPEFLAYLFKTTSAPPS